MKKFMPLLIPAALLVGTVGCDETALPEELQSLVAGVQVVNSEMLGMQSRFQTQTQSRLQSQDGVCDGDGYQYAGANGQGAGGASNGADSGDRDRLRDGGCGD